MEDQRWRDHNNFVKAQQLQASAPLCWIFELLPDKMVLDAADLGCGAGTDTYAMLERGWKVLAIDKDVQSVDRLKTLEFANLKATVQQFETLCLPPLHLVNASMALPFCAPPYFHQCWQVISESLSARKGYFSGHFFGPNDSWAVRPDMTFTPRDTLQNMFKDFNILWLDETEKDGKTLSGTDKHWHLFSIVARKL